MLDKRSARARRGLRVKKRIHTRLVQALQVHSELHRLRLVVRRCNAHISAHIVKPGKNGDETLVFVSTQNKELNLSGNKVDKAYELGKLLGQKAKEQNITQISFDRSGHKYHGRIKSLADGARNAGLNF